MLPRDDASIIEGNDKIKGKGMPSMKHFYAFMLSLTFAACSHLDTRSPTASDLSGTWLLDVARSDPPFLPSHGDDHQRESDAHGAEAHPTIPVPRISAVRCRCCRWSPRRR